MVPIRDRQNLAAFDLAIPSLKKEKTTGQAKKKTDLPTVIGKIFPKAKKVFDQVESLYYNRIPYHVRKKIPTSFAFAGMGIKFIDRVVRAVKPILDGARHAGQVVITQASKISQFFQKLKILGALGGIGIFVNLVKNSKDLHASLSKKDLNSSIDGALKITENVSDLTGIASTVVWGLKELGVNIAGEAAKAATSALTGVGIILSVATIILNGKLGIQSALFQKTLEKKFDDAEGKEGLKNVAKLINLQSPTSLQNHFGVSDGGLLKVRMKAIYEKSEKASPKESKEITATVKKAMVKRLWTKQLSYGLKVLAAAISIIGCAILLFTPLAPLGFGLLALSTATVISSVALDLCMNKQFSKALEKIVPTPILPKHPGYPKAKKESTEKQKNDLNQYRNALNEYMEDSKNSAAIRLYKWKRSEKKDYQKRVKTIANWEPEKFQSNPIPST